MASEGVSEAGCNAVIRLTFHPTDPSHLRQCSIPSAVSRQVAIPSGCNGAFCGVKPSPQPKARFVVRRRRRDCNSDPCGIAAGRRAFTRASSLPSALATFALVGHDQILGPQVTVRSPLSLHQALVSDDGRRCRQRDPALAGL